MGTLRPKYLLYGYMEPLGKQHLLNPEGNPEGDTTADGQNPA